MYSEKDICAAVAELVDARDLKSLELNTRASSILARGTAQKNAPKGVF